MGMIWQPKLIKPPLGTTLNKSDPINKGLLGRWLFNEGVGTTAHNLIFGGNNGTIAATWGSGKFGSCLTGTGTQDYGLPRYVYGLSQITAAAWMYIPANSVSGNVYFNCSGPGYDVFQLYTNTTEDVGFNVYDAATHTIRTAKWTDGFLNRPGWHFVCGTMDGVNIKIYVDGVLRGTTAWPGGLIDSPSQGYPDIYMQSYGTATEIIDMPTLWNRALSESEVQRLYRNPMAGLGRPLIELFSVSAGGGNNYTETINDGIGVTDAIGRIAATLRTLTDSLGVTDSMSKTSVSIRIISEALGITDAIVKGEAKVLADSLGITDIADKSSASVRTLSETLGITDSVVRTALILRAISETIGMTDVANKLSELTRVLSDTIGITDSVTQIADVIRTIADSLGITDSITKSEAFNRTVDDSLGMTDSVTRLWVVIRTIADDIGITDDVIIEGIGAIVRVINDTIGISDNASRVVTALRTLTEQIGMSDAIARVFVISRIITDSEGITDGIALGRVINISDTLGITDSVTRLVNYVKTQNDDIGILDAIVKVTVALRTINDVVGITDEATESLSGLVKAAWAFMMLKKHK
jgi:hypothetical protein